MFKFKEFLRSISVSDITLMHHIKKDVYINKTSKANYYNLANADLLNFISVLQGNSLYSVIPMLTINAKSDKSYIVLSHSILVSRFSNTRILEQFIHDKHLESVDDFGIENIENLEIVLKYRKINLDLDRLNRNFPK